MKVCEITGNPEHEYCEHCSTCHTCMDEHMEQDADARENLSKALGIQRGIATELKRALRTVATGAPFDTATAKILAENGFTVRHPYFTNDEYVKAYQCSGYPVEGKEWTHFFKSREDFPPEWSIVKC